MKLACYSDLHLEFKHGWRLPADLDADVLILAGDIITFKNYAPLKSFLAEWSKPALYVTGNHEYYTQQPIKRENHDFKHWLAENCPNVTFLNNEPVGLEGIHFFGGTMWTDFKKADPLAMHMAEGNMNDFRMIHRDAGQRLTPADTIALHEEFKDTLQAWFLEDLSGPRVVITHHAPVVNPDSQYKTSPLQPAFNSLDMIAVIQEYQPDLWIYGHTHECDDQTIGKTRIISNQLGYPNYDGGFESAGFDPYGKGIAFSV